MKKLNDKHYYLIIGVNNTIEKFLPILSKYGFVYTGTKTELRKFLGLKMEAIFLKLEKFDTKKTFWVSQTTNVEYWITREDILVIENCSSDQLESVLCEYYIKRKKITLFL